MSSRILEMKFDPNVITHLGINMYSTLPPVIAELVANAYDADATEVKIKFYENGSGKKIVVEDNGTGMSFQEINDYFLKIGRNRRDETGDLSEIKKRKVIGKKGLGKLSFFGISEEIYITSIKNGKLNKFKLDWEDLQRQGKENGIYRPEIIKKDENTDEHSGTTIELARLKRKSAFDLQGMAVSLAKYFTIFNEEDFKVELILNDDEEAKILVTNEMKYESIDKEFYWKIPIDLTEELKEYFKSKNINGELISSKNPLPETERGIVLFSRGKLVNTHSFFDVKASSHGYAYITGFLNIDFIDDEKSELISTNRQSLNWEEEPALILREHLNEIIKKFFNESKKFKKEAKKKAMKKYNIDIEQWLETLPLHDKKLAKKIIDSILSAEGIEEEKVAEFINYTKDSFQFESFKELANEIENTDIDNFKIIHLFKEWHLIENREFYKLAIGRIKTIEKFYELIKQNAKEVQTIHPFFEKFPWILDPRINMFRHEMQFVHILKEYYPEKELEEKNRRIDFLCTSVSEHKFIIELKRPHHKISLKDLEQAKDYRSFLESHLGNDTKRPKKVVAYVIGGKINWDDRRTRDEIENLQNADKVYVKTYNELLTDAKNYHYEFIEKYENMNQYMVKNTKTI